MLVIGAQGVKKALMGAVILVTAVMAVWVASASLAPAQAALGCTPSTLLSNVGTLAFGRPDDLACNTDTSTPATISVNHVQASESSANTCPNAGLGAVAPCIVARTVDNVGGFTPTAQFCTNPTNSISVVTSVSPLNAEAFGGLYLSGDGACDYRAVWTFNGTSYEMTGTATRAGTLLTLSNLTISGGIFQGSDGLDSQAASLTPLIMNNTSSAMSSAVRDTLVKRLRNQGDAQRLGLDGFYLSGNGRAPENHVWLKGQGTYFDGDGSSFDGYVLDILAGLDTKLSDEVVLGLMAGVGKAEFDTLISGQTGAFDAEGWHIGAYGGALLSDDLLLDIFVAYAQSHYDNQHAGVTGQFDAKRWTAGATLEGQFEINQFIITPSLAALLAHERQEAYVDSLGTSHAARDITSGKVNFGPKIARPFSANGVYFAPWVQSQLQYDFTNQEVGSSSGLPDIDGTFSASVSSGVQTKFQSGAGLDVSGHVAGLGTDQFVSYGGSAVLSVPF